MTIQKHTVLQKLYLGIKITTQGMQLRYFDYNLSRTSKLKLNGFLSLLSTSTTVLKQNN